MIGSSTVMDMRDAIIDGASQAFIDYTPIFVLIGGVVLAFGVIGVLIDIFADRRERDTIDSTR